MADPTNYPALITEKPESYNLNKIGVPVKVTDSLLESPSLQPDFAKIPIGAGAAQNKLKQFGQEEEGKIF